MKRVFIYLQEPNALSTWLDSCESKPEVLYNLDDLDEYHPALTNGLLMLHKTDTVSEDKILQLTRRGLDILLFSNKPAVEESLRLFQLGIKGYLNTFSSSKRIQQALEAIDNGHVWLGQNLMQSMIQSIPVKPADNESWKQELTQREGEVVAQVIQGKSNKEIAQALDITERTVKAHLQSVFQKFSVKDRLALVIKIQNWPS